MEFTLNTTIPFECNYASLNQRKVNFLIQPDLVSSVSINIVKTEDYEKSVNCPKCLKQFGNKKSLKSHKYDVHSGTTSCSLCPKTFGNISTHRRHMRYVHREREDQPMCPNCGKVFSVKDYLKKHEAKCYGESTSIIPFHCHYCEKAFSSKSAKCFHEKKKHNMKMDAGYYIISNEVKVDQPVSEEHICHLCLIPQKFKSNQILKKHMKRAHKGNYGLVKSDETKMIACQCCAELFTCQQNLEEHELTIHMIKKCFKCLICPKTFQKQRYLSDHMNRVHTTPSFQCTECGKKSKLEHHHKMHMKIHGVKLGRGRP